MSSTNSSDRLTLLSYATFNHHIPIHNHSWRQHQWKQTETMVALASLALQSAKKLFQKGNLENKRVILTLSGADVRAQSVGVDPYTYWGLYRFFPGHLLRQWNLTTVSSAAQMEGVYGDSYVRYCISKHSTWKASLALTLYISSSYSKWSVMAEADHSFSLRAVSMLIG